MSSRRCPGRKNSATWMAVRRSQYFSVEIFKQIKSWSTDPVWVSAITLNWEYQNWLLVASHYCLSTSTKNARSARATRSGHYVLVFQDKKGTFQLTGNKHRLPTEKIFQWRPKSEYQRCSPRTTHSGPMRGLHFRTTMKAECFVTQLILMMTISSWNPSGGMQVISLIKLKWELETRMSGRFSKCWHLSFSR